MDAKVTLSFNEAVIAKAKRYAEANNVSLSRLVEFLLDKATAGGYPTLSDFPVAEWVSMAAEGPAEYVTKAPASKKRKAAYFKAQK
jgi:hypothetical protein